MEIAVRKNEVLLARMQENLSILQKKGMGFAGKYVDHETYTNKHTNTLLGSSFSERDVADKLERIEIENLCAEEFETLACGFAKNATEKEMQQFQPMVFSAIEACICKGHLKAAERLVKLLAGGAFENKKNQIADRDAFVATYLKGIIKGYAKMTRQCIKRPEEVVTCSGNLELPISERDSELLRKATHELFAQWQEKHPQVRSVLSQKELLDIAEGKQLSELTLERIILNNQMEKIIEKHTPFCQQAQKLMNDIFEGKFGDKFKGNEFFYMELAHIYNHHMASANPKKEPYRWGSWSKVNEEIREYANKQRVKNTPPSFER